MQCLPQIVSTSQAHGNVVVNFLAGGRALAALAGALRREAHLKKVLVLLNPVMFCTPLLS